MRAAALAALTALVALAPTASACSWFVPELLNELEWHPALGIVGTSELFWRGIVDLENGTIRSSLPHEAVISPDGRFVALPRTGPDVQTGPMRMENTCGGHLSRHLVGWDRWNDSFVLVDEGPIWSMGARDDGVVTYRERETRVYSWGGWVATELDGGATGATALDWRAGLADPAAEALANERVWSFVRSPEGAFAAGWSENEAGRAELRIYRLADLAIVAREDVGAMRARLAWSAEGLAVLLTPSGENGDALLRVYREPATLGSARERSFAGERPSGLAWSPAGDRIAVSLLGSQERARLVVLDASTLEIAESRDIELDPVEGERLPGLASVPIPEYSLAEKVQATPAPGFATLALALALAAALSRRG